MAWSHFYGTVKGKDNTTEASRLGTADSGLRVEACSKQGAITVRLQSHHDGRDRFWVDMRTHGSSTGWSGSIAKGIMGEQPDNVVGILPTPTIESFTDEAIAAEVKRRFGIDVVMRCPDPPPDAQFNGQCPQCGGVGRHARRCPARS